MPWREFLATAGQALHLPPAVFWAMTPVEWCVLMDAEIDTERRKRGLLAFSDAAELDQLVKEHEARQKQGAPRVN